MVVVAVVPDRVVVKKVFLFSSKQFNLGRPSVWLETDEAKKSCGLGFVLSSLMFVINNTSKFESILKKKNNAACNHLVRESIAMGESLTTHINGDENPVNLLMKVICGEKGDV